MSYDYSKPSSKRIPMDAECVNCKYFRQKADGQPWCSRELFPTAKTSLCCDWQGKTMTEAEKLLS